jgi:hypothetical protein
VDSHLRSNLVRKDMPTIRHHRGSRLITGGLDAQDFHTPEIIAQIKTSQITGPG